MTVGTLRSKCVTVCSSTTATAVTDAPTRSAPTPTSTPCRASPPTAPSTRPGGSPTSSSRAETSARAHSATASGGTSQASLCTNLSRDEEGRGTRERGRTALTPEPVPSYICTVSCCSLSHFMQNILFSSKPQIVSVLSITVVHLGKTRAVKRQENACQLMSN